MKKFCYKKWVTVCAFLMCIVCMNFMVFSCIIMIGCGESGIYHSEKAKLRNRWFESICQKYSIAVLEDRQDDFCLKEWKNSNFRYAVIKADTLDGFDYHTVKEQALACNFDKEVTEDMLNIYHFDIGENTRFELGNSVFDMSYFHNEAIEQTETKTIEKIYYARDTNCFFAQTKDSYYLMECWGEVPEYLIPEVSDGNGAADYVWADGSQIIELDGYTFVVENIPIVLQSELGEHLVAPEGMEGNESFPFYENYYMGDGYVRTYSEQYEDTERYYVLSYVSEPLQSNGFLSLDLFSQIEQWGSQDDFVLAAAIIDFIYEMRYSVLGIFMLSLACAVFFFIILLKGAGHDGSEKVTGGWIEKIPYDVFLTLVMSAVLCVIGILIEIFQTSVSPVKMLFIFLLVFLGEILCLLFCMSTAVRVKQGSIWKTSVVYRVGKACFTWVKKMIGNISRAFPLLYKAFAVMAALAVLEFIGLAVTAYNPEMQTVLWLAEKIAVYAFLILCLLQMKDLQQAAKNLAEGSADNPLDTSRMFGELKQHGLYLNHIQEGIQHAVDERMKSERFKTELITNVSHDIKTPLTSIINYVDLLEKEAIENEHAEEYLEVLSRQSARLKKLIEDLMEASKASTGNLNVVYEPCDAGVMLVQTIGEFEEKLKKAQIDLLVKDVGGPFVISADPRHLWRIFENLMNNICKYAQPSTRAYVNIEKSEQTGKIIFRNVSKYELNIDSNELLERFVRGDSSRNTEGSGLGLSIAQSLTELMQGTFELVIDGDLFKVTLTFPAAAETL